jgi:hypothetical protein
MESNYRFVVATAFAAATLASVSDAGLVGTQCTARFYLASPEQTFAEQTFVTSSLLTEFYYSTQLPGGSFGAFAIDVRSSSMTVTFDYEPASGTLYFGDGTRLSLTIPESMQFDTFAVSGVSNVSGVELADVSGSGTRTLVLDSSGITANVPGASFTIDFTTSAVPGPSALVILSAFAAIPTRRRRG